MFTSRALLDHFLRKPRRCLCRVATVNALTPRQTLGSSRAAASSLFPAGFVWFYHAKRFPPTLQAMRARARKLSFGKTGEIAAAFSAVHSLVNKLLEWSGLKSLKTTIGCSVRRSFLIPSFRHRHLGGFFRALVFGLGPVDAPTTLTALRLKF